MKDKEFSYKLNYSRDVNKEGIVEKKQSFSYISWSHCEKIANEMDENFDWCLLKNEVDGSLLHNGMVLVQMTFNGKTRKHYYPILDNRNKPIEKPSANDINSSQMRGFAKLFSMMTGVGLSIFTGEDLVQYEKNQEDIEQHGKVVSETDIKKEILKHIKTLVKLGVLETETKGYSKYKLTERTEEEGQLTKEILVEILERIAKDVAVALANDIQKGNNE